MNHKKVYTAILLPCLLLFVGHFHCVYGQKVSKEAIASGKAIFNTQCRPCHSVQKEKLGPMLASITRKRSETWLFAFIRNSQEVILSGDEYANHLFREYNHVVMPSFEHLSEREISNILLYIRSESENSTEEAFFFPDEEIFYRYPQILNGSEIFDTQCASCHAIGKDGYGPSLGSLSKRLPRPWLVQFIQNSQEMIRKGDLYAVHLFFEYDQKLMPPFEYLSEEDIFAILSYIDFVSSSPPYVAGVNGRNIITPPASEVYVGTGPLIEEENEERSELSLKIIFIVFSLMGAIVHVYLIYKLFRYLYKETK